MNINDCFSIGDVAKKLGLPINGNSYSKAKKFIKENKLSTSHFDLKRKTRKYKKIKVLCPVCEKEFEVAKGHPKANKTCSKSCANTYFRSGKNHVGYKGDSYRKICFTHHKKKCIVCGETKIVAVHHFNENHEDNRPENLIPLCPTHHQYMHSRYKNDILKIVENYISNFLSTS